MMALMAVRIAQVCIPMTAKVAVRVALEIGAMEIV